MAIDLQDYLPNDCLAKVDIASMRHALEIRSPMLDHRVVELARQMPLEQKWRPRRGRTPLAKAVLRDAFRERLPRKVLARGKMGFGVPIGTWLAGPAAPWMRDVLLAPRARTRWLFRPETVRAMVDQHTRGRTEWGEPLWALLCLELWFRQFLDRPTG